MLSLAMEVARYGLAKLKVVPHARFGRLTTADRNEIEALRHIRSLMRSYRDTKSSKRPLSIGVFGPPGAGKSFGVREITKEVFDDKGWLEFNLSQFESPDELHGAFHLVRDSVLRGENPVAFWDGFDSNGLIWLQYLLAPMQDGSFQVGEQIHPIGKCVFVFAGGTRHSFQDFLDQGTDEKLEERFTRYKGRDFISRLDAHIDVPGPNPIRPGDPQIETSGVPVRRALLLRGQMRLSDAAELRVEPGLLRALLKVSVYRHASRSMEKLLSALHQNGVLRRSSLPARAQLDMHVPASEFLKLLVERPQDP